MLITATLQDYPEVEAISASFLVYVTKSVKYDIFKRLPPEADPPLEAFYVASFGETSEFVIEFVDPLILFIENGLNIAEESQP